jgi:spore germination cell wall hydrolase CwlJ-like protein
MNRFVRAGGVAAAALGLALSPSIAEPSKAVASGAPVTASYLDHASAQIDDASAQQLAQAANQVVAFAENSVPRPRSLNEMVEQLASAEVPDEEQHCLAGAVYFEARGEPIEGQLAVAEVVLNRAASRKYPSTICAVVKQPWQFSFVKNGKFPEIDKDSKAWRKAVAVARIASLKLDQELSKDVLWYHADYVAPVWRKALDKEAKIGLHIFYS